MVLDRQGEVGTQASALRSSNSATKHAIERSNPQFKHLTSPRVEVVLREILEQQRFLNAAGEYRNRCSSHGEQFDGICKVVDALACDNSATSLLGHSLGLCFSNCLW